jgi:Terminase large subunit, T4likevirus-type, N-terminal
MSAPRELRLSLVYHAAQDEIFFGRNVRIKVIRKGRRFGLTRGLAQYAIEQMLDGRTPLLWVDTTTANIDRYVERYFLPILKGLPSGMWNWRQVMKELKVGDGVMDFRSADRPENIEGFGYSLLILNEAGIILRDQSLWHNTLRPMVLDQRGEMIIGGTPRGKGLFHQLWMKGDAGELGWASYHFTSYDNPFLDRQEIDDLASSMPEAVRRQEIFGEFLDEAAGVFRGIQACISGGLASPTPTESYTAGLDVAKHYDWTVLTIVDSKNHVVFFGRIQHLDWPFQKEWIKGHVARYNKADLTMDSTGVGDAIYDDLKGAGLAVTPFKFTSDSKKKLIESLMLSIEKQEITFPDIPELVGELKNFEYDIAPGGSIRYNAPEGFHDDCVISLALANWARKEAAGRCLPGFFFCDVSVSPDRWANGDDLD